MGTEHRGKVDDDFIGEGGTEREAEKKNASIKGPCKR